MKIETDDIKTEVCGSEQTFKLKFDLDKWVDDISQSLGKKISILDPPTNIMENPSLAVKLSGLCWILNIVGLVMSYYVEANIYFVIAQSLGVLLIPVGILTGFIWALSVSTTLLFWAISALFLYTYYIKNKDSIMELF